MSTPCGQYARPLLLLASAVLIKPLNAGHIHCEKCLIAHVESNSDGMTASCPTCRAEFCIGKRSVIEVHSVQRG